MRDKKDRLISLRIKRDVQEELQRLAQDRETSSSELIRDSIMEFLAANKRPYCLEEELQKLAQARDTSSIKLIRDFLKDFLAANKRPPAEVVE